jgi:hypothetical protein
MDAGFKIMLPKAKPTKPVLREERIREFASEMALHFTGAIFDNLEGAKSGEVEPLHDMRVASRRLRETLRLFQSYYAPVRFRKLSRKARRITRVLGLPREMDVNLELLRRCQFAGGLVFHATCEHLLALFEAEQARLKRRMLREFERLELKEFENDLRVLADSAVPPRSKTHLLFAEHQSAEFELFIQQMPPLLLDKAKPIISSEQERQFTEIRSHLLQETEHIFTELDVLELSGKAMNVLQRAASIRGVRELPNDEVRRLEAEWNGVFTKLGLAQGQLKSRRKHLAEQSPFTYYLNRFLKRPVTTQ